MLVAMLRASEDATSGSVIANAERISPSSSGRSHCSRCRSVPNIASTSMLPVSGAAQFMADGARTGLRPLISASGAYCRFVRPAPCSPGRNRFHSPRSRACVLSSSMTGGTVHGSAAAATCSANTGSAGYTQVSMNSVSRPIKSSVSASKAKSITDPSGRG